MSKWHGYYLKLVNARSGVDKSGANIDVVTYTPFMFADSGCRSQDICFIIDTSVSVFPNEWNDLRQFVADVVSGMVVGLDDAHIGYVTYSHTAELSAALDRYSSTQAAITGIWNDVRHLNASTKTDLGLSLGTSGCFSGPGDRADTENLAILITDGKSYTDILNSSAALRKVARVVAVGIDRANEEQLRTIVDYDDRHWLKVADFGELFDRVSTLLQISCGMLGAIKTVAVYFNNKLLYHK